VTDTGWAVLGLVISTALAILFYIFPRERRGKLVWRITQDRGLLEPGSLGIEDLVLIAPSGPVSEPWVWAAEIINTGGRAIRADDFDQPFLFIFECGVQLLRIEAVGEHTALSEFGEYEPDGDQFVGFAPQLLNRGEKAELAILWDGPPDFLRIEHRFAGNLRVKVLSTPIEFRTPSWFVSLLIVLGGLAGVVAYEILGL
jgi:hypothetical protein